MQSRSKSLIPLAGALLVIAWAPVALAQYRCDIGGRSVVQSEPCPAVAKPGKFRCFVDGEVVYSDASCTTIKSKAQLAAEAKAAEDAAASRMRAAATAKEAADRPNFARRIMVAEQATAKRLRDPDSARFTASRVSWYSGYAAVCGLVSGRNGFGGYANPVQFVTVDDWVEIADGKGNTFDKHWERYCG